MEQSNKRTRKNAPTASSLFFCCNNQCRGSTNHNQITSHRVEVKCTSCNDYWIVCITCKRKFKSSKVSLAKKHFDEMHSSNTQENYDLSIHANDNMTSTDLVIINACLASSSLPSKSQIFFRNKAISLNYAIRNLVGQTFLQAPTSSQLPTLEESTFHLKLANILSQVSSTLHVDIIDLLNSAKNVLMTSTRLPIQPRDIARFYTKNKFSLYNQLPVPQCHVSESHTYVDLHSVIEHYIAFGYHMDKSYTTPSIYDSSTILQCKEVLKLQNCLMNAIDEEKKRSLVILFLMIWSDDFEPSSNLINKHSTWMRTVTICANIGFGVSSEHTYLLSLGYKSDNHDEVNNMFAKEIIDLKNGKWMYSGKYKRRVFVMTQILVMSADRPERNSLSHIMGHTGHPTKRWKYTGMINQNKLPSCLECLKIRFSKNTTSYQENVNVCPNCCDWNYNSTCRYIEIHLPDNYPRIQHLTSPTPPLHREVLNISRIIPVEQTFDWLKDGCKFCFHNVYHKVWNLGTSDEYMKSLGLSQSFNRSFIVKKAKELYLSNPNHPNPSTTMTFPPLWNIGTQIYHYIDLPMHLLFLGIVKSIIEFTFDWLKLHKSLSKFGRVVKQYHNSIKSLQNDFCKLEVFSSTQETSTAGWKADNYLAFCRVIDYSFGSISELKIDDDYQHEKQAMTYLHHCCLCLISRLMTSQAVTIEELERHVKIFLSILDLCERLTFTESDNGMFWFKRSNFLCLLNLPNQIDTFGPIRKYWEGNRERFIQEVKPLMKHTRETTSFLKIQLEKMMKYQLLKNLSKQSLGKSTYNRFKKFSVYSNIDEVVQEIKDGKALSALHESKFLIDSVYVIVQGGDDLINFHEINFHKTRSSLHLWSTEYTSISVRRTTSFSKKSINEIDQDFFSSCFCVGRSYQNSFVYQAFTSDWLYRQNDGKFKLPSIPSDILHFVSQYMS